MPKGVYIKTREHIAKVLGNLTAGGWNKGLKFPERSGENSPVWKGDNAGYSVVHTWLKRHFGKANKCENLVCNKTSKIFHWAKLKDKEYIHKRENFWMLCASCHAIYDEFKGPPPGTHKGNTYRRLNLIGQRFGKLVVISLAGKNKWGNLTFLCKCDCGGQKVIPSGHLRNSNTQSCGCITITRMLGNRINQGRTPWNKGTKVDRTKYPSMGHFRK